VSLLACILADIEAEMSDSTLVEKHTFSAVGLESLFGKLHEFGLIQNVSPMDIVQDLRAYILRIQ
jgi:hypothetical protein